LPQAVGLDFGTTNSALCLTDGSSGAQARHRLTQFEWEGAWVPTFRSLLYIHPDIDRPDLPPVIHTGPDALRAYLEDAGDGEGRLVQSAKSFLASRHFQVSDFFGTELELEDLIAFIVQGLREAAERQFGPLPGTVVVGRPVRFVHARSEKDDQIAEGRLESALRRAGFDDVRFELEPIAAALAYGQRVEGPERVLIGDFGGGTSDLSLVELEPDGESRVLGCAGRGVAGDAFDGRIVRHAVAPDLGRGHRVRGEFGAELPAPPWLYGHLESWHRFGYLRTAKGRSMLRWLVQRAVDPAPFEAFAHLVEEDLGHALYRCVERAKRELSRVSATDFAFEELPVPLARSIARSDFEAWIAPELRAVSDCIDDLLAQAGVEAAQVERVFLTGGSSFVPAVRALFERRFPEGAIESGGELTSVACGLGLRGLERAA